ncbi:MAG: phosphatase PAP2 family protein [Dehalococcoidia bacterium]|jgi:undecaprenyl-diphosphatase
MSRRAISVYALLIALFGVLCYFAHRYDHFPGDPSVSLWIQDLDFSGVKPLMRFGPYALILAIAIALRLWLPSRWRAAIAIALTALGAALISWLMKLMVNRPRPDSELVQVMAGAFSTNFPSMHMACITVISGFLFYLAPRLVKSATVIWLLRALLIALILFTGVARLYLGTHWLSDAAGGIFLGGLVLYPAIVLYRRYEAKNA